MVWEIFILAGANSLKIVPDAHSQAFSSGVVSVFPSSQVHNPASLILNTASATFSYSFYLPGVTVVNASLIYPKKLLTGSWGLSASMVQVSTFEEYNQTGQVVGYLGAVDAVLRAGWARSFLNQRLAAGFNLSLFYSSVAGETGASLFLSLGLLWKTRLGFLDFEKRAVPNVFVGFAVDGLGLPISYEEDSDSLPIILRLGISTMPFSFVEIPVCLGIVDGKFEPSFGLIFKKRISKITLVAGGSYTVQNSLRQGISFGLGIGSRVFGNNFNILYSGALLKISGITHSLELTVGF